MKHVKKLASLLLAMVMVFAVSASVFADENTATITAPQDGREYEVYQIFTGDLDGSGVLSNVKWGQNGTGEEGTAVDSTILEGLSAVNSLSNQEKLTEILKYVDLESNSMGTIKNGTSLTVATGYYLIKDNGSVGDGQAYSLYVVEVVGSTTVSPKTGTTTSEKKVKDVNDSQTGSATGWQDSADYDIGDRVPFQLKATIAQDYANYKVYKLTFHDKEDAGLTFARSSVKVYVDGTEITTGFSIDENPTDGDTFDVVFADLKKINSVHAGSKITVEYESVLNSNATVGSTGNKNTMHVTYSNNPNDEQGGENGKTPDDTVIVFTYKVVVNKVTKNPDYDPEDEDSEEYISLKGAGFTLYKKNASGTYVAVSSEIKGNDMTTFTFSGLDDGDYKLSETTTPAGYNTISDIEFTITAEHEIISDSPALTSLNGNVSSGVITFTPNTSGGSLTTDVINQKGSTLPSTGGMGTTLFYIIGGVLVVGAAVLLIVKRRMSVEK